MKAKMDPNKDILPKDPYYELESSSQDDNERTAPPANPSEKYVRCPICLKLVTATGLKNHELTHVVIDPFCCKICRRSFASQKSLDLHQKSHGKEKKFQCKVCGKKFPETYRLKEHMRKHTGERPYPCTFCPYKATTSGALKKHITCHTRDNPISLKIAFLKYGHLRNTETESTAKYVDSDIDIVEHKITIKKEILDVNEDSEIGGDTSKNSDYQPEISSEDDQEENGSISTPRSGEKYFRCPVCSKYVSASDLRDHEIIHVRENPFFCTICKKVCPNEKSFQRHQKSHTNTRPLECEVCGKKFTDTYRVKEHMRKHTGERPYPCTFCPYKATTSGALKRHISCHTRDNPINLQRAFVKFGHLRNTETDSQIESTAKHVDSDIDIVEHKITIKKEILDANEDSEIGGNTSKNSDYDLEISSEDEQEENGSVSTPKSGEKCFRCPVCSKYVSASGLRDHEIIHLRENPFFCTICKKVYPDEKSFQSHQKIHTNTRPFECEVCGKKFTEKFHLKEHMRTHTGERPYHCTFCPHKSTTSGALKKHMRRHTGTVSQTETNIVKDVGIETNELIIPDVGSNSGNIDTNSTELNETSVEVKIGDKNELIQNNFEGIFLKSSIDAPESSSKEKNTVPTSEGKNPFYCDICERAYVNKDSFKVHQARHLNIRPHKCKVCGKRFVHNYSLQYHMRTHTGERPYQCTLCSHKATTSGALRMHMFRHTEKTKNTRNSNTGSDSQTAKIVKDVGIETNELIIPDVDSNSGNIDTNFKLTTETNDEVFVNKTEDVDKLDESSVEAEIGDKNELIQNKFEGIFLKSSIDELESSLQEENSVPTSETLSKKVICPVCFKSVKALDLKMHELMHEGKNPFYCEICDKEYANKCSFRVHQIKHTNIRPHKCKLCGKRFVHNYGLKEHMRSHTGERPYHCTFCPHKSTTSGALRAHMRTHTKETTNTKNSNTGNVSQTETTVKDIGIETNELIIPDVGSNSGNIDTNFKLTTETNDEVFVNKTQDVDKLDESSVEAKTGDKNKLIQNKFEGISLKSSIDELENSLQEENSVPTSETQSEKVKCPVCFKSVKASDLKIHELMHEGKNPFYCEVCDKEYANKSSFKIHQIKHTSIRPHKCKLCGKGFVHNYNLKEHMQSHTGERPYQCTLCSHKVTTSGALRAHMKTHTKETTNTENSNTGSVSQTETIVKDVGIETNELIIPDVGSNSGNTDTNFKLTTETDDKLNESSVESKIGDKNELIRNNFEGIFLKSSIDEPESSSKEESTVPTSEQIKKLIKCSLCSKFVSATILRKHELMHAGKNPLNCEICGKTYANQGSFRIHLKIHTNQRPFVCKVCGQRFTTMASLKVHMRKHTGERPYSCPICPYKAATSSCLKKHISCHTKDNPISLQKAFERYGHLRNSETDSQTESAAKDADPDIDIAEHNITIKKEISDANEDSEVGENTSKDSDYQPEISSEDDQEENETVPSELTGVNRRCFECPVCKKILSATGLKNHEMIHAGKNPYYCDICDKEYAHQGSFYIHNKIHENKRPFACKVCGKKFVMLYEVNRHMRTHTGERPYPCTICPYKATTSGSLTVHMRRHAEKMKNAGNSNTGTVSQTETTVKDIGNETNELIIPDVGSNSGNIDSYFKLTTEMDVDKVFVNISIDVDKLNESSVEAEIGDQNELIRNNFEGIFLKNSLENSSKELNTVPTSEIQSKDWVKCPVCSKYVNATGLRDHELMHEGNNPFYCEICEKTYPNKKSLQSHKRIHTNHRPFSCEVCEQKCANQSKIKEHMRTHTGERPYPCTFCPYKATTKSSLKKHISCHTRDNPINLKRALEKYSHLRNSETNSHTESTAKDADSNIDIVEHKITIKKEISDSETGGNTSKNSDYEQEISSEGNQDENGSVSTVKVRFKCPVCSANLSATGLKNHEMIHAGKNPFYCEICDKEYASQDSFNVHKKHHADKRPFTCEVCKKKFFMLSEMNRHSRTHTNERPHHCTVCPYKSTTSGALKTHMRVHTRDNPISLSRAFEKYGRGKSTQIDSRTESTENDVSDIVENEINDLEEEAKIISFIPDDQSVNFDTEFNFQTETTIKKEISDVNHDYGDKIYVLSINADESNDNTRVKTEIGENISKDPDYQPEITSENEPEQNEPVSSKKTAPTTGVNRRCFECPVCKRVLSATGLKNHKMLHAGKNPFYCEICDKKYTNEGSFRVHQVKHMNKRTNINENESTKTSFEIKKEPNVDDDGKIFVLSINADIPNDEIKIKTEIETDESSHKSFEEVLLEGPNYAAESSSKNESIEPENTLATLGRLQSEDR